MRNARVEFGEQSCESLLPEDRGRESGQRGFMSIDVEIKKSNVSIVFFFLSEGYRSGLVVEEMEKKVNVVLAKNRSVSSTYLL